MIEMMIMRGSAARKISITFHKDISFTSFLAMSDNKNKNMTKVKNGRKITTPIRSHKSISKDKIVIVYSTGI
jgi:hypothetical protein